MNPVEQLNKPADLTFEREALPTGVSAQPGLNTDDMIVNVGPQHPSTHGVLRLVTTLNGEVVKDMEPVIGYLHRSKEKMAESRSYFQYQPTIDRVEYLSAFFDHYAYLDCIEKIAGLTVPKRVQYIRMITMEMNRITSHLLWFGTFLLDLGASSPFFYAFIEREELLKLFEDLTGARMMYNYYRFGGVNMDLPPGWLDRVREFTDRFPKRLDEYEAIVTQNPIFLDRTVGIGYMDKDFCLKYGATGPNIRAAGVPMDMRKISPYSCYDEVAFDVPVGKNGDVYDRYVVRFAEMRESIKIIRQAIDKIPGGDTADLMLKKQAVEQAEELAKQAQKEGKEPPHIPHWDKDWNTMGQKVNLMVFKMAAGEAQSIVESPRGLLGCYLISDGTPKAYRCKWRGASFSNLAALPPLMMGQLYSDLMAIFGSIDVIMPEVDR